MMTLHQAQAWMPGSRLVGDGAVVLSRVHTDSRTLTAGDLFVALKGERFDGGDYLAQAASQGAVAALCDVASRGRLEQAGLPGLLVSDAKVALGVLAGAWRNQFHIPLIAVTGSNGKTTVTQMIASILRAWKGDAALATLGNLNNDIGVPLTLLRLRAAHQVAVVELGMNHPGEISLLGGMARPTVALVNNAQREHLEFMATVDAVARENGAVIESLGPTGIAVFPSGDVFAPLWTGLCRARHRLTFSDAINGPAADVWGQGEWQGDAWSVRVISHAGDVSFTLGIAGRHNVRNALAAVACGLAAGAPLEAVRQGLNMFQPVKGRSRAFGISRGGRTIAVVDDTYNANPDSVRAAIDVLAELPIPRLLVLGDMGEVGDQGPAFHAEAGAYAREQAVEQVFTLGALSQHVASGFSGARHFADMDRLIAAVLSALPEVGSVVVKGSRFMRMEHVVDAIARGENVQQEGAVHAA